MTMINPRDENQSGGAQLLMVTELGPRQRKLRFTTGVGQRSRRRTGPVDSWRRLPDEIAAAKARFGLPADNPGDELLASPRGGLDGRVHEVRRRRRGARESLVRDYGSNGQGEMFLMVAGLIVWTVTLNASDVDVRREIQAIDDRASAAAGATKTYADATVSIGSPGGPT